MKYLIVSIFLLSGLFCSPVQSYAAPLICTTPNGLVAILGTTCAAAFHAKTTSTVPGLTEGLCAKVVSGELTYGTCASGATVPNPNATGQTLFSANGSTFSLLNAGSNGQVLTLSGGVPTWAAGGGGGGVTSVTSSNGLYLTASPTTGAVVVGLPTSGTSCASVIGSEFSLTHSGMFGVGGLNFDGTNLGVCGDLYTDGAFHTQGEIYYGRGLHPTPSNTATFQDGFVFPSGQTLLPGSQTAIGSSDGDTINGIGCSSFEIEVIGLSRSMCIDNSGNTSFGRDVRITAGTLTAAAVSASSYTDSSSNSATMQLGQSGAPSGACVSGSTYTRTDGGPGTTLYDCESSVWQPLGGGGGGPSLAADQTWTGINTYTNAAGGIVLGTSHTNQHPEILFGSAGAPSGFSYIGSGDGSNNTTVRTIVGNVLELGYGYTVFGGGFAPTMTLDSSGNVGIQQTLHAGQVTSSMYNDAASGASMSLGQTGAPSGACASGSIYTRADGTPGATFYACESTVWVAATTP